MRSALLDQFEAGRIDDARRMISGMSGLTSRERLVQCQIEAVIGNEDNALRLATDLAGRDISSQIAAEALLVAARVDFSRGRSTEGASKFAKVKQYASSVDDKRLVARAVCCLTEALLHFVSLESAATHFRELRQSTTASGTAPELFELRLILAETEAKLGHIHRAVRELDLADAILATAPHPLRQARLQLVRCNIEASRGDWGAAHNAAEAAHRLASSAGASVLSELALNNLAHAQLIVGRFGEARRSIASLAASHRRSSQVLLTRRSIELYLALAEGDLARAEEIDDDTQALARTFQEGKNAYGLWYCLARVKFLISAGRAPAGVEQAAETLARLDRTADRALLDRTRAAGALAMASMGQQRGAAALLEMSALGPLGRAPEFIAGLELVSAHLVGLDNAEAASHLDRSARIFKHLSHVFGELEVARHKTRSVLRRPDHFDFGEAALRSDSRKLERGVATSPVVALDDAERTPARAAQAAAMIVSLGGSPVLSGHELLSLTSMTGAAAHAALLSRRKGHVEALAWTGSDAVDPSLLAPSEDLVTIPLGEERGAVHEVVVRPANQGAARVALLALQRIAASAQTLHKSLLAESERSAIWPDPLPEQQLGFVCASESMLDLLRTTRRVASSNITVLITGETGTGKELLARAVHQCSPRHAAMFQPYNCTAVSKEMLDSQLFGYRKGSFTGAQDAFPGVIRSAAGGTLFLDEIGEISLDVQPKLLRFLEANEVHPLGEPSPIPVDVRVVAATNANLDQLVAEGKFREDLFYRLNVVRLAIPPLRERREEIPLLLDHFLERSLKDAGKTGLRFAESTSEYLLLYAWPGNVRELANEVRRLVALAEPGAVLMPEHLSPKIAASRRTVPPTERPVDATEFVVRRDQPLSAAVEHVERTMIQDALRATANVELAAKALGLSRKGLYLKRQRLRLDE